ncbi:hypothetical protein [Actinomadura flavalba]|uniref:hypothetical protein n=1 Tax=Actinomadura flavalba TaxID=1120938 RepID=UPI000361EC4E|nr:hypothetical protein [Actinomadura flavalba]
MTTGPSDEQLGEVLRRALHAEADTVIPADDGLERIRTRIAARPARRFGVEWFTAGWARPALAVAAAVAIAGFGVSAPETLRFIQAGGSGAPAQSPDARGGDHTGGAPGGGAAEPAPAPSGSGDGDPRDPSEPPPTTSSTGAPACGPAGASAPATPPAASPSATGPDTPVSVTRCPSPSSPPTKPTPSPGPSTPAPQPTEPTTPTDQPTPPAEQPTEPGSATSDSGVSAP